MAASTKSTAGAVHYLSIAELGRAYRARELDPVSVTRAYLDRIAALEPRLRSHITVLADAALAEARASAERFGRGAPRGALDGVPIGLKALYDTAGVATTGASRQFVERIPDRDATLVRRLREAGAVITGKHMLNEFASGRPELDDPKFPPPRNPWDTEMLSGGSSSGSSVAVAAGLCAGAFGSDTGGSIRLPASNCGIVGLKPTNGVVSLAGVLPLSWTLDVAGPIARTVEDTALLMQAVAGYDPADLESADVPVPDYAARLGAGVRGVRVGVPRRFIESYPAIDAEALAAFEASLKVMRDLGATVEDVATPDDEIAKAKPAFPAIMLVEALAFHGDMLRSSPERYGRPFLARLREGEKISALDHALAHRARRRLTRAFDEVMRSHDLLALPTVPWPHRRVDDNTPVAADRAILTFVFNLTAQPAISVPSGFTRARMPLGFQLAARRFEEPLLLGAAAAFERAVGSAAWHPPLDEPSAQVRATR